MQVSIQMHLNTTASASTNTCGPSKDSTLTEANIKSSRQLHHFLYQNSKPTKWQIGLIHQVTCWWPTKLEELEQNPATFKLHQLISQEFWPKNLGEALSYQKGQRPLCKKSSSAMKLVRPITDLITFIGSRATSLAKKAYVLVGKGFPDAGQSVS